jgi:hypothetical protein
MQVMNARDNFEIGFDSAAGHENEHDNVMTRLTHFLLVRSQMTYRTCHLRLAY